MAFDVKDLGQKLKEKGMPELEQFLKDAVAVTSDWAVAGFDGMENKFLASLAVFIPVAKEYALKLVEKLDIAQAQVQDAQAHLAQADLTAKPQDAANNGLLAQQEAQKA